MRPARAQGSATIDANSIAVEAARNMAAEVAEANGVFVDPQHDVKFGKRDLQSGDRRLDRAMGRRAVQRRQSDGPPQRRRHRRPQTANSRWPSAGRSARTACRCEASSTAFTEARDLVLVLDLSASMNDDSSLNSSLSSSHGR